MYPRTRKALGGREGKLQEIAAAAAEAWADLQLTRSQSDREELVDSYTVALPDDLASLPGSGRREVYRIINLRVDLDNSGTVRPGGLLAYPQNEDHIETRPEK